MEQIITETIESQTFILDATQYETLVDILDYQKYMSNIQIAILTFLGLACGILLCSIFAKYMRG